MSWTTAQIIVIAVSGSAAIAGTWAPDFSHSGDSYHQAIAEGDIRTVTFNEFGTFAATATPYPASAFSNTLEWDASGAQYEHSATSAGNAFQSFSLITVLHVVAHSNIDYAAHLSFDWQGYGQEGIITQINWIDVDAQLTGGAWSHVASGVASTSYSGSLVQGHRYRITLETYVWSYEVNVVGEGIGSGFITLDTGPHSIPLPSVAASAAFGLLGLGMRRRRGFPLGASPGDSTPLLPSDPRAHGGLMRP